MPLYRVAIIITEFFAYETFGLIFANTFFQNGKLIQKSLVVNDYKAFYYSKICQRLISHNKSILLTLIH